MDDVSGGVSGITRRFGVWSAGVFADSILVPPGMSTLYLSGMGAEDEQDGHIRHAGDIEGQARYSFEKIRKILGGYDADLRNVVKMTSYLTDAEFRADYSRIRLDEFGDIPLSTHTFIVVPRLAWPDMLVEIDVTAVIPAS